MTQGYRCGVHPQSSWRTNCTIASPDEAGAGEGAFKKSKSGEICLGHGFDECGEGGGTEVTVLTMVGRIVQEQRSCAELVHGRGKRRASAAAATDDVMVKEWRRWWWCRTDTAD
ncbi:unnamed protein product [Calypogeia fissa]